MISMILAVAVTTSNLSMPIVDARAVAPPEPVESVTQAEWSTRWWQWAASFKYGESPVADLTGARCGAGQKGNVWFLAGTYESSPVERTCTVPADRYLFFPLINYFVSPSSCNGCTLSCEQATLTAEQITDKPMGLIAELDGAAIADLRSYRQKSPACFNLSERVKGAPRIYPSASNGYWVMLKPLPKGRHTLRLGGSLPSLRQDVTYRLEVQ